MIFNHLFTAVLRGREPTLYHGCKDNVPGLGERSSSLGLLKSREHEPRGVLFLTKCLNGVVLAHRIGPVCEGWRLQLLGKAGPGACRRPQQLTPANNTLVDNPLCPGDK